MCPTYHHRTTHCVLTSCARILGTLHPMSSPRHRLPNFRARGHGGDGTEISPAVDRNDQGALGSGLHKPKVHTHHPSSPTTADYPSSYRNNTHPTTGSPWRTDTQLLHHLLLRHGPGLHRLEGKISHQEHRW